MRTKRKYVTMKRTPLYITLGLLFVSAVLVTGAVADDATPLIAPLISDRAVVSAVYAEEAVMEEVEAINIPDMAYGTLRISPAYSYLQLQPGETETFTVTISNRADEELNIDPVMVIQPYTEDFLEEEWVTVTPSSVVIKADEKKEFTVEIAIPEDADLGYYGANIVFDRSLLDNELVEADVDYKISSYYGNSLELSVEVWIPPSVEISTTYINDRVKAGEEYDYEITLVNTGDEDISMSPELGGSAISASRSFYDYESAYSGDVFTEDSITIDAPSVIRVGETVTVTIHVKVPEGAQGGYAPSINLGIADPALNEWENQVYLYLALWEQPSEPFVTEFVTTVDASIKIEVTATQYEYSGTGYTGGSADVDPTFDLVLKNGNKEVDLELVKTVRKGYVNFGNEDIILYSGVTPEYQQYSTTYTEVYEVVGGIGEWELSILSENTDNFEYSITSGDSE